MKQLEKIQAALDNVKFDMATASDHVVYDAIQVLVHEVEVLTKDFVASIDD